MAVIIIGTFYWTDEETKCCTISDTILTSDGMSSTYCKKNGKYYNSGVGGIIGTIPEHEITEHEYNSALQNGKCK